MNPYEFTFRGLLAEEALDRAGRVSPSHILDEGETALAGTLELLDERFVDAARAMSTVYAAVAAFENSARKLVSTVLLENVGEDWWETHVSEKVRTRAETRRAEEEKVRWHRARGDDPINYTELNDLVSIMSQNVTLFEPHIRSIEWARSIFQIIERSRNVIMHSGDLDREDIERVGINIRDWVKQVGG